MPISAENRRRGPWWQLVLLAVLAVAAYFMYTRHAATISGDSYTYVKYARLLADGRGAIEGPVRELIQRHRQGEPALVSPVWNTVVLPDGRWVYTVAPGYPLLLAGLLRLGGEAVMLQANLFLQLATLAVFFTMLAMALRGRPFVHAAALVGVVLLLCLNVPTQHQFVQLWREPFMYLLLLGAAAAYLGLERQPRLYWSIPFLLGLACATKESNVLYAGWMGVALLLHPAFRARPDRWRAIGFGVGLFLLGCAPLLIQNWSFTGRPWTSIYVLRETSQFAASGGGAGLSIGNFPRTLGRYARMYQPYAGILLPLLACALWGGWRHRKAPATILLAGWLALHVGLYLQWGNADFRHMYFANYPIAFFAALGLHDVLSRVLLRPRPLVGAYAVLLAALLAAAILRQPARPVHRARDWRQLTARIAAAVDPDGVLLVNRPLRDLLGGYTDLGILRFHELMHATGQAPAELAHNIAQDDLPVFFLDAPDLDPASKLQRRDLAAMDWKYLLQGCDPEPVVEFKIADRRMARYLGRSTMQLYRLRPWSRNENLKDLAVPAGGAAFLAVDPKGLDEDLQIEVNGEPLSHDFHAGTFIPLSGTPAGLHVAVRRKTGGPLPLDLGFAAVDCPAPLSLPIGEDARPDDRVLFAEIQPYQPIQERRRFYDSMNLRVPVREGTDLFTVVQVDLPYTDLEEGTMLGTGVDDGPHRNIPISDSSLWIAVPPPEGVPRGAGYRRIQVAVPAEKPISVDRLVSRVAWQNWPLPPDAGGECGAIVFGWLAPRSSDSAWRYFEGEREVRSGAAVDPNPRRNPFAAFLPAARLAGIPALRWAGVGLMDLRIQPVDRRFRLGPNDPLAPALTDLFHPAEENDAGTFRWTGPDGVIRLPCSDGSATYRLRLDLAGGGARASNRVDVLAGGRTETVWLGHEVESCEWTVSGFVPEHDWATVRLAAAPWSPADSGSRDHRTLGVQWYGAEWERIGGESAP